MEGHNEFKLTEVTTWMSVWVCCLLSILFVFSLYIVNPRLPRNHPLTVCRRIEAITSVCLLTPILLYLYLSQYETVPIASFATFFGVRWSGLLAAICYPPLLVGILYSGPIIQSLVERDSLFSHITEQRNDIILRNYLFAPITEEFIFRVCMLLVLRPAMGEVCAVFICPLFFGIAHIHHLIDWYIVNDGTSFNQACITVLVQACYTTLFGLFAAFLFVRTGHLISLVICHSLCNIMGLPPIESAFQQPRKYFILFMYVVGVVAFFSLLLPMTSPLLYSS